MLSVQWEQLTEHFGKLGPIVDCYRQGDPRYTAEAMAWIEALEALLVRFRRPEAAQVSSERAQLQAVMDGYRSPGFEPGLSQRRAERAATARALANIEVVMRERLGVIEKRLGEFRQSIAQLLAVSSQLNPIPMPSGEPRTEWLKKVWHGLMLSNELRQMYAYINGSLALVDRLYLLDDVLTNLLAT
jgi:hypothetical protein